MRTGVGVHPEVAINDVAAAVEQLHDADFANLTDRQLTDALVELHRLASSLEAACTKVTAITDARDATVDDGAQSIARWLTWKTRMPLVRARREARNARSLRHLPLVEAAFVNGEITGDHVRLLASAAASNAEAFDRDVELLVDHARSLLFSHFVKSMRYWLQANAPDDAEDEAARQVESRNLHLSQTFDGTYVIDGVGPAVSGTIVANELRRLEQHEFETDVAEAKERLGRTPNHLELRRTPAQRRWDALEQMARRSAAHGKRRASRPLFTVLVGYDKFTRTCELSNGTVVTPGQLAPYVSEADVERVVFDGPSRVLDVGVRQRIFTGATRRAIEVRDRECWHPSCDRPADECEADHDVEYELGGLTVQENGKCGCKFHHRLRHKQSRPPPQ